MKGKNPLDCLKIMSKKPKRFHSKKSKTKQNKNKVTWFLPTHLEPPKHCSSGLHLLLPPPSLPLVPKAPIICPSFLRFSCFPHGLQMLWLSDLCLLHPQVLIISYAILICRTVSDFTANLFSL